MVLMISVYRHSLFVPLFLGVFTWLKATLSVLIQSVTPKLAWALAKNSLVIKLRDLVVKGLTELAVLSHRPWRRRLLGIKSEVSGIALGVLRRYVASPLWLRCAIALALLAATAGSAWAALALLVIPQPIIEWLKRRGTAVLQKLGVLRFLDTLWRGVMPADLRERWDRYRRWTLGRQQIRAARVVHKTLDHGMRKSGFRS